MLRSTSCHDRSCIHQNGNKIQLNINEAERVPKISTACSILRFGTCRCRGWSRALHPGCCRRFVCQFKRGAQPLRGESGVQKQHHSYWKNRRTAKSSRSSTACESSALKLHGNLQGARELTTNRVFCLAQEIFDV